MLPLAVGLGWTSTLSKENDTPVSKGLTAAHSGTRGPKVSLRVVPRRLKKEKTERGPASWFKQAMPWTRGAAIGPTTERLGLPCTLCIHMQGVGPCGSRERPPPTQVSHASPGQVLCHSPQGFLLLGPVLGCSLVGHLQPQPFPAARLQDLHDSKSVGSLPPSQAVPCWWGTCLFSWPP